MFSSRYVIYMYAIVEPIIFEYFCLEYHPKVLKIVLRIFGWGSRQKNLKIVGSTIAYTYITYMHFKNFNE